MRRILISCLILLLSATLVQGQTRTTKAKVGGNEKVKEEIGNILREMSDALWKKDRKVCERYLAPSYHAIDAEGGITSRAEVMQGIEQGRMLSADMKVEWRFKDLEVFVDGNSAVAIYCDLFDMQAPKIGIGGILNLDRVSTYFVRNGKSWQILAVHRSYPKDFDPTEEVDPKSFEAIIGEYQDEDGLKAVVTREGDRLYCQKGNFTKLELILRESSPALKEQLKKEGRVSFSFKAKDGRRVSFIQFNEDREGKVTEMVIYYPLPDTTIFVQKKIK